MRSAVAIAVLVAASAPGEAVAQARWTFSLAPTQSRLPMAPLPSAPHQQSRPWAMPVIDYVVPDGRLDLRRGIIAGVDVGSNASFGVGIFQGAPKRRMGAADPAKPERRSRRAAVGLSLKF